MIRETVIWISATVAIVLAIGSLAYAQERKARSVICDAGIDADCVNREAMRDRATEHQERLDEIARLEALEVLKERERALAANCRHIPGCKINKPEIVICTTDTDCQNKNPWVEY